MMKTLLAMMAVLTAHSQPTTNDDTAGMQESVREAIEAAKVGDWKLAHDKAETALMEKDTAIPHQVLSQIHLLKGDHIKSLDEIRQASNLEPNDVTYKSQALFHEGIVAQDMPNYPLALTLFKRSIDILGDEVDVKSLEKVALATAALGDIPTAVTYLKTLWNIMPMYSFHNSIPFVRIVDVFEDQVEHARMKGTLDVLMTQLSNITTVTDRVWFDVSIDGGRKKRIEIGLYGYACPIAVSNFKHMVACDMGGDDEKMCFRDTTFHRIIKDFIVQGGDSFPGDGTGRSNIFDRPFGDEVFSLALMHDGPGIVQMANSGADSNGGQFVIMSAPAAHLNGNHVVMGRVLKGVSHVGEINRVEVNPETYKPKGRVEIVDSGVFRDASVY